MQTESLACTNVESSPPDPCICAQQMVCRLSMRSLNRSGCARARTISDKLDVRNLPGCLDASGERPRGGRRAGAARAPARARGTFSELKILRFDATHYVFARACARSEAYEIFQSYACHLRNPAVQQATVEIRDTEFPAPPPPSIFGRSPHVPHKITLGRPSQPGGCWLAPLLWYTGGKSRFSHPLIYSHEPVGRWGGVAPQNAEESVRRVS